MDLKKATKKVKIIDEFKKFIRRGNMLDLAVGMIIGTSFNSIVSSLVNDIFMPILGWLIGDADFTNFYLVLSYPDGVTDKPATLAEAQSLGLATFNYGSFITAVIHFLIMAFIVFLIVKGMNKLLDLGKDILNLDEDEPAPVKAPTTKICPFCMSEISIKATRCPHCTSELPTTK